MSVGFGSIPDEVIDYVRSVFGVANDKVSKAFTLQPSMHEEGLDHFLIAELSAVPPTFLAKSSAAVGIETHWLGGRRMYRRWEIADIAVFIMITMRGKLVARKVALLQTKRLYSNELSGPELEEADFRFGIGRLADRTDNRFPLSTQRTFNFDAQSKYAMLLSESDQVDHIDTYVTQTNIPVYYGLYNPMTVPYTGQIPTTITPVLPPQNIIGCRIIPSADVHRVLAAKINIDAPSYNDLTFGKPFDPQDGLSTHGWRIERFIADEVLKCRQGRLFPPTQDMNLNSLLYERSAPITAAIAITIDFASD